MVSAFKNCDSLLECYTPNATNIGNNAFNGCTNLNEAVFSDDLTYLGKAASEDYSGEYDGVIWSYTADTDTLYINTQNKTSLKGYDKPETSKTEQLLPTLYETEDDNLSTLMWLNLLRVKMTWIKKESYEYYAHSFL